MSWSPSDRSTAILSARYNPELYQFFGGPRFFLAIMLGEMLSFGVLVGVAIIYRRRPEIHRPMMLLASLMIISGSLARCPYIGQFAIMPPLYVLGPALALGALFLVLQWGMTRTLNRWYAVGYSVNADRLVHFYRDRTQRHVESDRRSDSRFISSLGMTDENGPAQDSVKSLPQHFGLPPFAKRAKD